MSKCAKKAYLLVKHHGQTSRYPYCWEHGQVFRKGRMRLFGKAGVWVKRWENDSVKGLEAA